LTLVARTDAMTTPSLVRRPAIATALLLLVPACMTWLDRHRPAGDGWHWGPGDFVVMAALLFGAGVLYEWLAHRTARPARRWMLATAIVLLVVMTWAELAVDAVSKGLHALLA
jgi:hypothetical protein